MSPIVNAAWGINSLVFSNNAGAFVLGGSALNIRDGGVTNSSANSQTINNAISLATNQTWSATAGKITFNGNINNVTHLLTISGGFNSFITGVISGTGGLTKVGAGTNFLSGTNTYSGFTTVSAGALNLQNNSALGSTGASATVASGATLQLQGGITVTNQGLTLKGTGVSALGALRSITNDNAWNGPITLGAAATIGCDTNSLTLGGGGVVISNFLATFLSGGNIIANGSIGNGTNGLTKTGAGTLTLTASNSYGGLTTVSAGVLNLQNNSALGGTAIGTTVANGAQLQLQNGISVADETLSLRGTGVAGSGALRNMGGSNSWNGTITLAAAATIGADAGTLDLEANIVNSTFATTFTNTGTILFNGALGGGTGGLTKIGAGTLMVNGAQSYTGATAISGGTLQFGATGSLSSASAITANAAGTLDLNGFNESILSLAGAGAVTLGGGTLTVNNIVATTFSGVISGAGALNKLGAATFTISGTNTFSGSTTVSAGAISIPADTALGNATNVLTLNGGTLMTSATLTSARPVTLEANGGIINAGGTTLTLSGTISGPGFLTKVGANILALTGANTYLGGTTNVAGTISINADAALGDPGGSLVFSNTATLLTTASFTSSRNFFLNAGTATFNAGTGFTNTLNGVISGAGAFTKAGAGVLVLGGSSTFTNLLTISAGTLRLGADERIADLTPVNLAAAAATFDLNGFNETIGSLASTAAAKVTLGDGLLTAGGNDASTTFTGVMSGNGGFTKSGAGTLIFSGANTYTNTTTVGAGTLQISASERIANTSPLVVNNGATFNLNNFNETVASLAGAGNVTLGSGTLIAGNAVTSTFSGAISGTGAFTKTGAGMEIFSGTNSYSGATTVSVGNLQVNGVSMNSAVTIASLATLSGNGTVGSIVVNSGATNSPGVGAPGTLNCGPVTWAGNGNYAWEINDAAGTKGGSSGWDWLNISGTLTINATVANKFKIQLVSLDLSNAAGTVTNFDNTVTYIWTIATASGGISGFDLAKFNLITSGFQNPPGAGTFTLSQSGNDLNLIFTSSSQATIKGVQSGTLTSTGNGTNTATLATAVNPAGAFLIFSTRHDSSAPGGSMIRGRIASSNSVEFVRATAESSSMDIQWSVVEYSSGVRVQRGEINQTNTAINVPLTPLAAVSQAFVTWSKTPDPGETSFSDSDPVAGEITSPANLQFRVGTAPSSAPVISWQVVEFLNPASISVQKGSLTNLTGTNLLATATLEPVNTHSTFVLAGYRTSGAGAGVGARMLRAQLTDASTVTFDRSIAGSPDDISEIAWQAVQLNDGSFVQGGSVNLTNGIARTNVTVISLNTNRAVAFASVQSGGGQNAGRSPSTGNVLGVGSATLAMKSATQLTLDRNHPAAQADIGWQVVGFGSGTLLTPATGGEAISADTTTNVYTSLTGPVYTEIQSGNIGTGTIILRTPAGFVFDTSAPQPTVLISRIAGSGADSLNINHLADGTSAALTTVNTTTLTFTVTAASSNGVTCSLTWQNLRLRPTAGTPLASGNLISQGTALVQGVTTNSTSWGFLAEVVGAASKLGLSTQPSATAVAGVEFAPQPVVQIQDKFGNPFTADDSTMITAASSGTDTNGVNGSVMVADGVAAFSGMSYQIARTNTITFSAPGLISKTSSNIVVTAAAASQLAVATQPSATATAGVKFTQQPVIQVRDQFGNLCKTDNVTTVTAVTNQGTGDLSGTASRTAINGVITFTNLSYQIAETIALGFIAPGLGSDISSNITVVAAAASQLVIQTQPSPVATAGVEFAQQPVILVRDAFGNLCVANNSTVVTASRNTNSGSGTLQGRLTATASGGVATFTNLSHNVATTISVDFKSGVLTNATSDSIVVGPAVATKLVFITQPGSATVGSIFGVQPVIVAQDAFGNNSASGLGASLNLALALTTGTGPLLGTTNLDLGTGAGNGAASFTDLRIDALGTKRLTASASGLTSALSATFAVGQGSQTISFDPLPDKTYGDAPFALTASASSGLPVTFSIVAGPASVSGSNVTLTGAGAVTVRASQAGNANYAAATPVDQSFAVSKAGTSVSVSSSLNPSGFKDGVTFTANLPVNVTGSVAFLTNGSALSENSLGSGSATSAVTTGLPRGTNTITVQYAGDGNYFGSTNNLVVGQIVTNHPPVAAMKSSLRTAGLSLRITLSILATNWSDVDGDPVTLAGINLLTTNNVSLLTNSTQILYPNSSNVNDLITYTISDGQGGTNTGIINVVVNPFVSGQQGGAVTISGGSATVQFLGIPTYTYITQRSTDAVNWVGISTNTVPSDGVIMVTDTFGDLGAPPASAYYRLVWTP